MAAEWEQPRAWARPERPELLEPLLLEPLQQRELEQPVSPEPWLGRQRECL
jgi:hypothetical protein